MSEKINNIFNKLNKISVGEFITQKTVGKIELSYLSWSDAFTLLFKEYDEKDVQYKIFYNEKINDLPIFGDERIGYYVKTEITICGITKQMILPVFDYANKPKKLNEYKYTVKYEKSSYEKICTGIDMMDINNTVQRCLVKNLAIFGLGLSVYRGDDLFNNDENENNNVDNNSKPVINDVVTKNDVAEDFLDKTKSDFVKIIEELKKSKLINEEQINACKIIYASNKVDDILNKYFELTKLKEQKAKK